MIQRLSLKLSDLIPENIWVRFSFNHNSQTGRLPDVHIHILHDAFKLRRHYKGNKTERDMK